MKGVVEVLYRCVPICEVCGEFLDRLASGVYVHGFLQLRGRNRGHRVVVKMVRSGFGLNGQLLLSLEPLDKDDTR